MKKDTRLNPVSLDTGKKLENTDYFNRHFKKITVFDVNKMSGRKKIRTLFKPDQEIRLAHENAIQTLKKVCSKILLSEQGGFHTSVCNNILRHKKIGVKSQTYYFPRYFYSVDLKNAFSNTPLEGVKNTLSIFFQDLKDNLGKYCFIPGGGLITGAPASPILFYIYLEMEVDTKLREICKEYNICYTRYADDLVFSSNTPFSLDLRRLILNILRNAGFKINYQKTALQDLSKGPICINGIMIENKDNKARMFIPSQQLKRLKGMLTVALHGKNKTINNAKIVGEMNIFLQLQKIMFWKSTKAELKVLHLYQQYKKAFL